MAQLVIKGHQTCSNKVIEILEMLGGKNSIKLIGSAASCGYYIDSNGNIAYHYYSSSYFKDAIQFTIEEFLEQYPYKIGDKVLKEPYVGARRICEMRWDTDKNCIKYGIGVGEWFNVSQIQPYKEETMEENTDTAFAIDLKLKGEDYSDRRFCYKIPNGYEIDCVRENEIILKPIKLFPKTYEECHKLMVQWKEYDCNPNSELILCEAPIHDFCKLIVARNIYWKIAGEQMGLGKPWEPDFTANVFYPSVIIEYDEVVRRESKRRNTVLVFPTTEMRDAFYENFKELIELCKELL